MIINGLVAESAAIASLYLLPKDWASSRRIHYSRGVAARAIDPRARRVDTDEGTALPYDRLVLATGARSRVPPIDGFGLPGSFVLRTIDDAVAIQQHVRRERCRTAVIVGVELLDGQVLEADLCLVATGIEPDTALAAAAGLAVGRGVIVDDRLLTSDPHVFAVGDLAEHRGRVYGLWTAGVEQATVAAVNV